MNNFYKNRLIIILFIGLAIRIFFTFFLAKPFFNRPDIFVDGDTSAWVSSFENLLKHGIYTIDPTKEYGYFFRMPGYSFFIGIFYLLTGGSWSSAYPIIAYFQIVLDVIAIFLIYKIVLKIYNDKTALIAAFLYSVYPFVIVWNPVVYSESISIFFMITSLYFMVYDEKKRNMFFSGAFAGLAVLCRPQIALLIPALVVYLVICYRNRLRYIKIVYFALAVALTYGWWPARNYVNHGKVILTQDLRGAENWNTDVIAFMQYIYSVKTDWDPQFSQIIHNEKVSFPTIAYTSKDDSLKLEEAMALSKTCGSGFSQWRTYYAKPFTEPNCNARIAAIFTELRNKQIEVNPLNFYVMVPLSNLSKALFKFNLTKGAGSVKLASSLLFIYRTILILLGIIGCIAVFRNEKGRQRMMTVAIFGFFALLYFYLCAGTGVQIRNIEMRYLLQADVLMLIPAAYLLGKIRFR